MLTQLIQGRVYDFNRVVGRSSQTGAGFRMPVKVVVGEKNYLYVLSRGYELIPVVSWNRAGVGARVSKISIGLDQEDEEHSLEFSTYGDAIGELIWPSGMALDSNENVYVTDEWLNRISVWDKSGNFLATWGQAGCNDGELDGPSGIAIDSEDNIFIADTHNHRIQKFTKDGTYITNFGSFGSNDGELKSPWGLAISKDNSLYVADFLNHRVQKMTLNGKCITTYGRYGIGHGELNHPSDVTIDPDGDVYVCDWANSRIQLFNNSGKFLATFIGDAQNLSKWAKPITESNPDTMKRRREVDTMEPEWRFGLPTGVTFDPQKSRFIVADTQRQRLQIYNKVTGYMEPQRNL